MTAAGLAVALFGGLVLLAVVLNHCQARLALIELALNEGLPPGYPPAATSDTAGDPGHVEPTEVLPPGVHLFLSRTCFACSRLVEELDGAVLEIGADLHLHFADRPRPLATQVAARHDAALHDHQDELRRILGADPLPYAIAVGPHGLVSRSVTPTVNHIAQVARDAGIAATVAVET